MNSYKKLLAIFSIILYYGANAQTIELFKSGDKVMFVGNSITDAGFYHSYIWLYYMTRFPNTRIEIVNKGVGGDDVGQMNDRLDVEVLPEKPTVVVLTFGMNDSGYFEYLSGKKDSVAAAKAARSYNNYLLAEDKLKKYTQAKKIIMTTAPYDETTTTAKNNYFPGKNIAIGKIIEFQKASALKNHWGFIDLNKDMTAINLRQQAIDSAYSLSPGDRIHPGTGGHLVMAYYFLKAQGLTDKEVAHVNIDASANQLIKASNSKINNLAAKPGAVKFTYLAEALPFPIDTLPRMWNSNSTQRDALSVIPFTKEFNQEVIAVQNLEEGNYVLKIDDQKIGEWSSKDFAAGVNLAEKMSTPQYQQAIMIRDLNQERMELEKRFRQYNWVEFDVLKQKGLLRKHNQEALQAVTSKLNDGFVRGNYENWTKARNAAVRDAWNAEMKILVDAIYANNKPVPHIITIEKILMTAYCYRMKKYKFLSYLLMPLTFALQSAAQSPVDYVNPFIGASTSAGAAGIYHGLGKTFPGATTPFGMVQVSPNTITGGDNGSGYSYEHTSIEGFAFTQMSGVGWFGDLGNFLVMPATGKLKTAAGNLDGTRAGYRSGYDKSSEKASAGYYSVLLTDAQIKAEMTAAPHSGMLRFTFPANQQSRIQIDLARRVGGTSTLQKVEVVDDHTIQGWMKCTPDGGGWGNGDGHADYTVYFYAQFSKPLKKVGIWSADIPDDWKRKRENIESDVYQQRIAEATVVPGLRSKEGKHLGFYTEFETKANEVVLLKSGISFVSIDGARKNLSAEIKDWNFDQVHEQARSLWNGALSKIKVGGGTKNQKTVFYTSLYHTMIDPRILEDVDGNYPGGDGKVHQSKEFTKHTIFSGWDVFRSQMPLQTIINPTLINDLINSLITLAHEKDKDYLERWEFMNAYSGCMLGNPAVSVIADAYAKGIRGFDVNEAYRLSIGSVEKFGNKEPGFTPNPLSISYTLEYAYFDWCVAQLAKRLGKEGDANKYAQRSLYYKNIFDLDKGWFRPKLKDGSWEPWPAEGRLKQWYGCMESNPYQQGWFVPQDVEGMVALMGGREKVTADLVSFFEHVPDNMMWNDYYNHANEPVHHVPFLFNRLGVPALTQKWTRAICERAYKNSVEGLVGNEDVGQMSAWYILASSGLHPICPGDTRYEITSPVYNSITLNLSAGEGKNKSFIIKAVNNSKENIYIQSAKLNGKPYNKCFIDYKDIMNGGVLELVMGDQPSEQWGK